MFGDFAAPGEPHAVMGLRVIEEAQNSAGAARTADQAVVQADRHHFGMLGALGVKRVETVAQIGEEIARRITPPVPKRRSLLLRL